MNECPICLDTILEENKTILNCKHEYCINCIIKLLNKNKFECPLCRNLITEYKNNNIITKYIHKLHIKQVINIDIIKKLKLYYYKKIIKINIFWILFTYIIYYVMNNNYYYCENNYKNLENELNNNKENVYIKNNNILHYCSIPFKYLSDCFNDQH